MPATAASLSMSFVIFVTATIAALPMILSIVCVAVIHIGTLLMALGTAPILVIVLIVATRIAVTPRILHDLFK